MTSPDAIVGHGQGYEEGNPPRVDAIPRPSIAGRLEMAAAKWLMKYHEITPKKAFFSGYVFPGRETSLARVDAKALMSKTGLTEENVIVEETARTTLDEVNNAANEARKQGWKHVLHITVDPLHELEVKMLAKRAYDKDVKVDVVTAEKVFKRLLPVSKQTEQVKRNQARYLDYFKKYNWSRPAIMLRLYEIPKVIITALHGEKLFKYIATTYRPDPTQSPLNAIKSILRIKKSKKLDSGSSPE